MVPATGVEMSSRAVGSIGFGFTVIEVGAELVQEVAKLRVGSWKMQGTLFISFAGRASASG